MSFSRGLREAASSPIAPESGRFTTGLCINRRPGHKHTTPGILRGDLHSLLPLYLSAIGQGGSKQGLVTEVATVFPPNFLNTPKILRRIRRIFGKSLSRLSVLLLSITLNPTITGEVSPSSGVVRAFSISTGCQVALHHM